LQENDPSPRHIARKPEISLPPPRRHCTRNRKLVVWPESFISQINSRRYSVQILIFILDLVGSENSLQISAGSNKNKNKNKNK
jgi:hypothetical protein